jgi:ABC-type uncharacterized transport system substrate-binding protein
MLIDMSKHLSRLAGCALASLLLAGGTASAHPHVWVSMTSEVVYAPDGTISGVRHAWTFDDMFSVFAVQGLESKTKDVYTREELAPLAKTNVESLKEFEYFTLAKIDGKKAEFKDPSPDFYLEYKNQILTLHFTLPFKAPVKAKNVEFEIFDPSYFVDFSLAEKNPVALVGAPAQCKVTLMRPGDPLPDARQGAQPDPNNWGAQFANKIVVKCP